MSEAAKGETTVVEPSRAQATLARRAALSRATVPDFTVSTDVDLAAAQPLLAETSPLALAVRAAALTLREQPRVNASYRDARFELHGRVNIGVGAASAESLVFPTVFDADRKRLGEIASDISALAERAREGVLTPPELAGATFSVLAFGVAGAAIVNPPQAAILAVGPVREAPVVRDGAVSAGQLLTLTLSCDARILYGDYAAAFLARVRELLEAADASVL